MKPLLLLSLAAACAHAPPPETAPMSTLEPTSTVEPASPPASPSSPSTPGPTPVSALSPSPTHRVLEWLVDVITRRHGDVSMDEIAEYCGPGFLGPTAGTQSALASYAKRADGAVLESIEVDDPTYVRAYLATRDHRWKLIFEIDKKTELLEYLRFADVP